MEGLDPAWGNALWDASCTLRQRATPYRPSRISSSVYKRGRVRGVVDFFERSASESSDLGEDEAHEKSLGQVAPLRQRTTGKRPHRTATKKWDFSESENESSKLGLGHPLHTRLQENITTSDNPRVLLAGESLPVEVGTSTMHSVVQDITTQGSSDFPAGLDLPEPPMRPPASANLANDALVAVLPPQSGTPVNLVLGPDDTKHREVVSPEAGSTDSRTPNNHTPNNKREVDMVSMHPREESEPTMAELYEQTYGSLPPSPHGGSHMALTSEDQSGDEISNETVKIAPVSDQPPTALRPVVQRKASSLPRSLRRLFVPSPELQANSERQSQGISPSSMDTHERDEVAIRTIDALKERVAIVERRLEAMELKEADSVRSNVSPHHVKTSRRALAPIKDELDNLDHKMHSSRPEEGLRTRQSAFVLLVGATTGISMMLIPLLLRHLWSR
jgi:hypothetical protein